MVELKEKKYGIDILSDSIRIAGRTSESGKINLLSLNRLDKNNFMDSAIAFDNSDIYFSIPENEAVIKKVKIPSEAGIDAQQLAKFEFAASYLDSPDNFILETYPLNGESYRLVFGYRRGLIEGRVRFIEQSAAKPAGFKLRAWALAAGYLNYCQTEGGELVCLLDISGNHCSLCFLDRNRPVMADCITGNGTYQGDELILESRSLADLVAVIQYHQLMLFNTGCTAPLSSLIISGEKATFELFNTIEKKLGIRVARPRIKNSLFAQGTAADLSEYLVCLGLTVD